MSKRVTGFNRSTFYNLILDAINLNVVGNEIKLPISILAIDEIMSKIKLKFKKAKNLPFPSASTIYRAKSSKNEIYFCEEATINFIKYLNLYVNNEEFTDFKYKQSKPKDNSIKSSPNIDNYDLEKLGIIATVKGIDSDSIFDPKTCLSKVETELWFMGTLSTKWIIDRSPEEDPLYPEGYFIYDDFVKMLNKLELNNKFNSVKFLIINPNSIQFKTLQDKKVLYNERGEKIITLKDETTRKLFDLQKNHSNVLEVRMYNTQPCFRIIKLNDNLVGFSSYTMDPTEHKNQLGGRTIPHLIINKESKISFYHSIERYFLSVWKDDSTKPISDLFENI